MLERLNKEPLLVERQVVLPGAGHRAGAAFVSGRAVSDSLGLDEADPGSWRLYPGQQVCLWYPLAGARPQGHRSRQFRSAATSWCFATPATPTSITSSA